MSVYWKGAVKSLKTLGIYIHIPFCVQKCNYCDFLSAPATKEQQQRYIEALKIEIKQEAPQYKDYTAETIFFGGGTPSILDAAQLAECIAVLYEYFSFAKNTEITVETNPGTATRQKLAALRSAGVNRLSIGVQSANNQELKMLGRIHTYQDFLQTYQWARVVGFTNINIDLISALPGQTLATWSDTLKKVTQLSPEHISAYSLMIEEGTPLYQQQEAYPPLPSEDEDRQIYQQTKHILAECGYHRYEISNYAETGYECRHNKIYWQRGIYHTADFIGFGLGASSTVAGKRWNNTTNFTQYLTKPVHENIEQLTINDQMEEFIFLGLRMTSGISKQEFFDTFHQDIETIYKPILDKWTAQKMLTQTKESIQLTDAGMDVSNVILADFLHSS